MLSHWTSQYLCVCVCVLERLTDSAHTVFSPRFNTDGSRLVYFHCSAGGPHHSCASLNMVGVASLIQGWAWPFL